jgi:Mn2+/Fe2+ NRAMP family transporter
MQLYQAAAVADRGIGPDDYGDERVDAVGGAIFANLVSMAIIVATAAAIGSPRPIASASDAAKALVPVAGHVAETVFGLGLLGASALAAAVVPLSTAYALAEAVGVERSVGKGFREAGLFVGLFTAQLAIGAAVALAPGNLIHLLVDTQILNGLIAPVILGFILVLANRRDLLGDAVNGPRFRVLALAAVVVVGVLAAFVVVDGVASRV